MVVLRNCIEFVRKFEKITVGHIEKKNKLEALSVKSQKLKKKRKFETTEPKDRKKSKLETPDLRDEKMERRANFNLKKMLRLLDAIFLMLRHSDPLWRLDKDLTYKLTLLSNSWDFLYSLRFTKVYNTWTHDQGLVTPFTKGLNGYYPLF